MDPALRYAPEKPFPSYAFVPGRHPHPIRDPDGHSFGQEEKTLPAPIPEELAGNIHFRFGLDLFNFGYYWEAHEAWEELMACRRPKGEPGRSFERPDPPGGGRRESPRRKPQRSRSARAAGGRTFCVGTNQDKLEADRRRHSSPNRRLTTASPPDGFPLLAVRLGPDDFANL
jgi:hypothetical protein